MNGECAAECFESLDQVGFGLLLAVILLPGGAAAFGRLPSGLFALCVVLVFILGQIRCG